MRMVDIIVKKERWRGTNERRNKVFCRRIYERRDPGLPSFSINYGDLF